MGIVEQYLLQLNSEKRRWRYAAAILTVLSFLVAVGVSWNLRMTGITIANGATCGQTEHRHSEACASQTVLVCGYPESPAQEGESAPVADGAAETDTPVQAEQTGAAPVAEAEAQTPAETPTPHVHTEACYQTTPPCPLEEHTHQLICYADTTVDLETSAMWESTVPQLTGRWAEDLVLVAQSQIGNGESERNYIVAEDGQTHSGITRYGQWYGNPYGDWSAMFALFCMNYAQIPEQAIPHSPGVYNMMRLAQDAGVFVQPDSSIGIVGNLLFLDTDANGNADRIVLVAGVDSDTLTVIGGDWENTVAQFTLAANDPRVMGYINVEQLQQAAEAEPAPTPEPTATPQPEQDSEQEDESASAEPEIALSVEFSEEGKLRIIAQVKHVEETMYLWQWQYSEDGSEPWVDIEGADGLVCELEGTEQNYLRYYRLQGRPIPMTVWSRAVPASTAAAGGEEEDIITSEAVAPFRINKNNNTYTVDVYALPVDGAGNRLAGMDATSLGSFSVSYNDDERVTVADLFDDDLGIYHSAYFGNLTTVSVNNVQQVWSERYYNWGYKYALCYRQTNGTENNRWKTSADTNISLYLRYQPKLQVTFQSEGFDAVSQIVDYGALPTLTEPGTWTREGYTLLGWTANGDEQNVYTYDELMATPVTTNTTYTAKWTLRILTVRFDPGEEYAQNLYPIEPVEVTYGSAIDLLPVPMWKNNAIEMVFDGWYRDQAFTQPVTGETVFYEDTILYAKWSPKDEGYYVYFMDFERGGEIPLVIMTYGVTEGQTAAPYVPGNAPEGTQWDGKWYLERDRLNEYNFSIPVSQMTDYLTGVYGRDLYLYPGTKDICRAIFVTYGTRVDPISLFVGDTINLDLYKPERTGFTFTGWTLQDGTPVSGVQTLTETTTYYATWQADYVPFEAVLRVENANDTGMTQAKILGTWYAKAGSQIKVKSTYSGSGSSRKGTHTVVCVLNGVEYPVYTDATLKTAATLTDVYNTYFIYNNTGTNWTDEVNWDDIFIGGELPYSTRPVSSAGDTIISFDYMRVRRDITFTIPNTSTGGYIDVYKLQQNGLITGSVSYTGTKPTATGQNVSATGVSAQNISWSYTAASRIASGQNNYYTLHDMKYGQRIFEVYPVGGSWLTTRSAGYHQYKVTDSLLFSSRRQDLTNDFFTGSGRGLKAQSLTAEFKNQEYIALMYAVECLKGETPDFTLNGVGYKVNTQLCEVVKHTGDYSIKDLDGCEPGISANGTYQNGSYTYNKYYSAKINSNTTSATVMKNAKVGDTSVLTLFSETYWPYYSRFNGVAGVDTFSRAYIFYYNRLHMNIQFNFGYDQSGDGKNEIVTYEGIAHGESISEYQYGKEGYQQHPLLEREGYQFVGWLDANGFVMEEEDWASIAAIGDSENNTMIFIAKWERVSNNVVEYYEDRSATEPFESHFFDDGELMQYPTMTVYPEGWVWQMYGEGTFEQFDWDVPMYGEYGVQEVRRINGEDTVVNVIRIYGTWDDSHTRVIYDPNAPQGGIPGSAPTDGNEYTIWQSAVPVTSKEETTNTDPAMVFVGWKLDRDGVVYQPGDHVPVRWPRVMTFVAQWAKPEDVVYLRYDPNGGSPDSIYPNEAGFPYARGATAAVWNNAEVDGTEWFTRVGYTFTGWNTKPDGSGTAYAPDANILLTEPVTTLYAQWQKNTYTLSLHKVDSETNEPLDNAKFNLYKQVNGAFYLVGSVTTGTDGNILFPELEVDTVYKLVEEKPPGGYAVITKEILFKVMPEGSRNVLVFYDAAQNIISAPAGVTGEYISSTSIMTLQVQNLRGYVLPSTGGTGTILYMLCGLMLTLAPLGYGLGLRRKHERRSRN